MAAASASRWKASVLDRSRMISLRTTASSAIRMTVRTWTIPIAPLGEHQQRTFELKRDNDSKDHTEYRLEHGIIGRVKIDRPNAERNFQDQIPQRERDYNGDQSG